MNPSILHFSRTGSAIKALFFLAGAAIAFMVASLMYAEREAPARPIRLPDIELPAPAPRHDPLAPFKIPLLIVSGCVCLFYAGRHGLRGVSRAVAAKIENGHLHFHSSYGVEITRLPIDRVTGTVFDRADRLPGGLSGSARFGARFRHGLHLRYYVEGEAGEVRLIDNDIDGGAEQLRRFAAHLDSWRHSAARTAQRG